MSEKKFKYTTLSVGKLLEKIINASFRKKFMQAVYGTRNAKYPIRFNLQQRCPPPYNQDETNTSCTVNILCAAYKILEYKKNFQPSRSYLYSKEKLIKDSTPGDLLTELQKYGVCPDSDWPFPKQEDLQPPSICEINAKFHKLTAVYDIDASQPQGLHQHIKICIMNGYPISVTIAIYESMNRAEKTGLVPLPNPKEYYNHHDPIDPFIGGHEVLIIGYDDQSKRYIFLNSWGSNWGDSGFGYMPYSFAEDPYYSFEFKVLVKTE